MTVPQNCITIEDARKICAANPEDSDQFVFSCRAMRMVLAELDSYKRAYDALSFEISLSVEQIIERIDRKIVKK